MKITFWLGPPPVVLADLFLRGLVQESWTHLLLLDLVKPPHVLKNNFPTVHHRCSATFDVALNAAFWIVLRLAWRDCNWRLTFCAGTVWHSLTVDCGPQVDRGPQVAGRQLHSQTLLQGASAQLATRTGDAEAGAMKPRSTNCGGGGCFVEQSLWKNNNDDDNETDRNTERTKRSKSRERESKRQDTKGTAALTPWSLSFFPPDALLSIF